MSESRTTLPKRYEFQEAEPRWQRFWEERGVFRFHHDDLQRPVYSVDTPPPTVSGAIHMGHVFSYVQAEAVTRFWRQRGYNVFYPFGFDDNGLPTERFVENRLKIRGRDLPRDEFVRRCLEVTREVEQKFRALWQSLGFSADWSLEYSTIDERSQRISQRSFLDLLAKGLAYRKETPALWCTECRTAVAQAEEEDVEKETLFSDLAFELEGGGRLVVATTRPELLASCVSVFVHPEDEARRPLVGRHAVVPLFGQKVPVLENPDVDREKGTGVVMCCTFGDTKDIEWWERYRLPLRISIGRDGTMTEAAGPFAGLPVEQARQSILEALRRGGALLRQETVTHVVNTHERCGTPIEFLPARQWFIKVLEFKEDLLAMGRKVRWFPESMRVRYEHWVENLHWDWCISRQRFFGVPIPVWHCPACAAVVPARDEDLPVDPKTQPPPGPCPSCGTAELEPEPDVLDTWATSSVTPEINARWGEKEGDLSARLLPMTLRPQAHDIIRTWAFYTIVKSFHHHREVPWRDVMISGHVVDAERQKLSKSRLDKAETALAKVFSRPDKVIGRFSADAVRYWACRANLGVDTAYDEKMIQQGRRLVTKLWNASRFTLSHLEDYDGGDAEPSPADLGLLAKLARLEARATRALETYEFGAALREVEHFFWSSFCDNYLEMVKSRLYEPEAFGAASRRGAQATLYRTLLDLLKMFAPFLPHITEEIYQLGFRSSEGVISLHIAPWPEPTDEPDAEAAALFDAAVDIIAAVRKFKSDQQLSMGASLRRLHVGVKSDERRRLQAIIPELRSTSRAQEIVFEPGEAEPSEVTEAGVRLWIETGT